MADKRIVLKRKRMIIIAGILVLVLAGVFWTNPVLRYRNHQLSDAIQTLSHEKEMTFEEAVPFEWDYVYRFTPNTPKEDMEKKMGLNSRYVTEVKYDDKIQIYVVKDGKIVAFANEAASSKIAGQMPEVIKYGTNEKIL